MRGSGRGQRRGRSKLLLDTSLVVALRRGDEKAKKALGARRDDADEVGISRLTQYELLLGATYLWRRYHDAREVAWLEDAFRWLKVYDVDESVVRDAAELQAEAMEEGEALPDMDLLVALSAKSGTELLTLDADQLGMKARLGERGVTVSSP